MNNSTKYIYETLDCKNEELIKETALCLSETFIGVEVNGVLVREPMAHACNMTVEVFSEFVEAYIHNVVEQNLCFIARDKETGKVVGALACEIFNPEDEVPVFDGELSPMNEILRFLLDLDIRFMESIENQTGNKVKFGEYSHAFMIGVRTDKDKKYIAKELMDLFIEESINKNLKGMFVEATNFRSQKLITTLFDFYVPADIYGKPIVTIYKNDDYFYSIPESISTECAIMYMPLDEKFELKKII